MIDGAAQAGSEARFIRTIVLEGAIINFLIVSQPTMTFTNSCPFTFEVESRIEYLTKDESDY